MTIEFSIAQQNLRKLIEEFSPLGDLSNEAQTRFSFVDRFLKDCLGWTDAGSIKVEVYEHGDRTDYECGQPRQLVIEAKRASEPFKFPARSNKTTFRRKLRSICDYDQSLAAAISQATQYCQARGVQAAAVANGPQLVVFLATRLDGVSPNEGDALVFHSYEDLLKGFPAIFDALTPAGLDERRLAQTLGKSLPAGLPQKLAANCLDYFQYKYASVFQENLRNAASIVIEDLIQAPEYEDEFLKECYCGSGPLTQFALVSRNMLAARYAALFSAAEAGSRVENVSPKDESPSNFRSQAVAEAMARRPIVLIGDVGVGKTSFLKHLIRVRANTEFKAAISIYFDLGSKGVLSKTPRDALLHVIATTLRKQYAVNLQDSQLIEEVYKEELTDFDGGAFAALRSVDPAEWLKKRLAFIQTHLERTEEHLRLTIQLLAIKSRKQVVIVIDNADQRDLRTQQDAFLIAQELAASWKAMVFLALRPQTFHASKRSGAISAYPPKVFVIPPPKLEDVLVRRLAFAQKIAQGKLPVQSIEGLTMHIDSLETVIGVLLDSISTSKGLMEFIINVSGGNVRVAIELIANFIGNPNIESEYIVKQEKNSTGYRVPVHEFSKVALLGEYAHFQEDSSLASNVFNVVYPDPREHFLSLYLLGYLSWDGANKEHREGFIRTSIIREKLQELGYTQDQVEAHLKRLTRKKLLETTERRQLENPDEVEGEGLPEAFRLTSLGAYHLKRWAGDLIFLEAMAFDTPIFDVSIRELLAPHVNDNLLNARYQRAVVFADYLSEIWSRLPQTPYFDWPTLRATGAQGFAQAKKYLVDHGYISR